MEEQAHDLNTLFEQLGLPHSDEDIDAFVAQHRPLESTTRIFNAPFWTPAQAAFLKESLEEDADWAECVDQLNALLRD